MMKQKVLNDIKSLIDEIDKCTEKFFYGSLVKWDDLDVTHVRMLNLLAKTYHELMRVADMWTTQSPDELGYLNGLIELAQIALEEQGLQCNTQTGEIARPTCRFDKGLLYLSEEEDCLTDNDGYKYNSFGRDVTMFFRPATNEEILQNYQRMTSAKAKEALLPDRELTEFEDLFIHIYQQKYPCELSDKDLEFCRKAANELLSIARKQFIEEAYQYLDANLYDEVCYDVIRPDIVAQFINDFRKALEKGV